MPTTLSRSKQPRPAFIVTSVLWVALLAMPLAVLAGADGLSLAVGALTVLVGALTATFSCRYMRSDPQQDRFFCTLGSLVLSVLVLVFSGNLALFALGWCGSGWLLARLVGHSSALAEARPARDRTLRSFIVGDSFLVAALAVLGFHAGSIDIPVVLDSAATLSPIALTLAALCLLVAACARCALPPFSGWLMSSMTAPTPVSALMHAGLVNAGGFLLLRFAPLFEASDFARYVAVAAGLLAAFLGLGIMMVRSDIKGSIAGSTVAQMGFMIMSCGLGAYAAALWHLIAHGLFKAWLFLGSGSAIGMNTARRPALVEPKGAAIIATVLLAMAGFSIFSGIAGAGLVPLILGLLTALTTFAAVVRSDLDLFARLGLWAGVAGLIALNVAGLVLAGEATGPNAPDIFGTWVVLALLAAFLGSWVWQHLHLASRRPLPPALYTHLLNFGALR